MVDWGSNLGPAIFQLYYWLRKVRPELLSKVRYVYTHSLPQKNSQLAKDGLEHGWILLFPPP